MAKYIKENWELHDRVKGKVGGSSCQIDVTKTAGTYVRTVLG